MYKVTLEKGYREIVFRFKSYLDASAFIEMVLDSGDGKIEINISYEPDGEIAEEGEE